MYSLFILSIFWIPYAFMAEKFSIITDCPKRVSTLREDLKEITGKNKSEIVIVGRLST